MWFRWLVFFAVQGLAAGEAQVPPEIEAASLLRAGGRRVELLERAFTLAAKARYRLPVAAVPGLPADSKALTVAAARAGYDTLSLQTGAVRQMLGVDPARARRMFEEISKATPEAARCEDTLLADVEPYYEILGELVRSAFTATERRQGAPYGFALAALNRVGSVAELRPAMRMTAAVDWPGPQLALAMGSLEAAMRTHSMFSEFEQPDSRSYLASFSQIESAVAAILQKARKAGVETESFSKAYRFFVVRQMRATRCNDTDPEMLKRQPTEPRDVFGPAVAGALPALGVQEVTPVMIEGEIQIERFWQTADAKEMLDLYLALTQGQDGKPLPPATFGTPAWRAKATAFAARLEKWEPGAETDGYHQKAMLYESMMGMVADGELNGRLVSGFMGLLRRKIQLRETDPVEWSWHARAALGLAGGRRLAEMYRESGDPILEAEASGR